MKQSDGNFLHRLHQTKGYYCVVSLGDMFSCTRNFSDFERRFFVFFFQIAFNRLYRGASESFLETGYATANTITIPRRSLCVPFKQSLFTH